MAKFKIIENQGQVSVRQKLSSGETINSSETAFFSRTFVKGMMRPTVEDPKKLLYIGARGVPLIRFVRRRVNKAQFFMIIAQIAEIVKKTTANNLRLANLVLDAENIIINDRTGDLFFIYQPITGVQNNMGLIPFLRQLVSSCSFDSNEDTSYANNFVGYLNSLQSFSMPQFENYIYSSSPSTYPLMQKMGYVTGGMAIPRPSAPAPQQPAQAVPVQQNAAPRQAQPQQQGFARPMQQPQQQGFARPVQQPAAPVQARPMNQPTPVQSAAQNAAAAVQGAAAGAARVIPPINPQKPSQPNPVAEKIIKDIDSASAKLRTETPPPSASLLDPTDEGTMLLSDLEGAKATLRRRSNGDELKLSDRTFRIGKDPNRTDYCVTNNKTVSRLHASIIYKNGNFFIVDHNSTNKTFVNGTPILAQTETMLKSGDVIKLSNEEFDFTL